MVTHIQPVGADPKKFSEDSTEIYGVGALLLAGSELYRMSILSQIPQINIAIKNHGPERIEDLVEVDLSTVKDLPSGELSIMDGSSARILPSTRADQSPSARKNILFLTALDPGEKKRYRVVPSSVLAAVPPIDSKTQPYFFQVLKQRNPSFRQTALQIAIE